MTYAVASVLSMSSTQGGTVRSPSAEQRLLRAALAGDGRAFRALVEPQLPMLYRIAARVSGSAALAEDAVQETLTLIFVRLHRYRPGSSFRAYVATIAARQAHTLARSERRRRRRELQGHVAELPATPEQQLDATLLGTRLREAINELADKRRAALLLRFDGALSYREIAAALGTSEGAARVLIHQAHKQLRAALGPLEPQPSRSTDGHAPPAKGLTHHEDTPRSE